MKKIFLINFPKNDDSFFGDELSSELEKKLVPVYRGFAEDFALDLGNGREFKPKLILDCDIIDAKDTVFFFKKRMSHNRFHSTLLANFLPLVGSHQINEIYKEHHKNIGKMAQAINLVKNGYRVPRTLLVHSKSIEKFKDYIEKEFKYPFVLKGSGSGGYSVWKVGSFSEIKGHISSMSLDKKETIVIQEYIDTSHEEFRVVMFLEEPVAIIRRASEGFYNNYSQGADVSATQINNNELENCKNISKISGLKYLSIDFMRDFSGDQIFLELQTGPSMTVSKKANPEIIKEIATIIRKALAQ